LLKPGDAKRLDISHIASASLSLSVLMSHISGVIDDLRKQIRIYCSITDTFRTSITTTWGDMSGKKGFPSAELLDFYETWIPIGDGIICNVLKAIQVRMINRVEKTTSTFKEQMTVGGMSLYVGIMHAMTEFERVVGGDEDERRSVEKRFFRVMDIIESGLLLKVDQEVRCPLTF
jgi:hypothetical protein